MKPSSQQFSRLCLILAGALGLACSAWAQSANASGRPTPGDDSRPTIPSTDKLVLFGQVATAAEAKPLIERYYSEQEQLFQEQRAAIVSLRGKTPEEQLKIMRTLLATQHDRRKKNRELEVQISAMLKQDREGHLSKKATAGNGK